MEIIKKVEEAQSKVFEKELLYRITGETGEYIKSEEDLINVLDSYEFRKHIECNLSNYKYKNNYLYQLFLNYSGDKKLRQGISLFEKEFRKKRKTIEKEEYEKKLRELINMRNELAVSLGYDNFILLKNEILDINPSTLRLKIEKEYNDIFSKYERFNEKDCMHNFRIENKCFELSNQYKLAKDILSNMGLSLQFDKIKFHINTNNKSGSMGAVIPISSPNDIHLIVHPVNSFLGFTSLIMHEVGHAVYFTSIDSKLPYEYRTSYNSTMDEAIAIFFESIVFTKSWFEKYLNIKYPEDNVKECMIIPEMICCSNFEQDIYKDSSMSFDEVWNYNKQKYFYKTNKDWTAPHFFISNAGYFSSYLQGTFIANDLKKYLSKGELISNGTGQFLKDEIFSSGRLLDFNSFLKTIQF